MPDVSDHSNPRRRLPWIGGGLALLVVIVILALTGGDDAPTDTGGNGTVDPANTAAVLLQRQLLSTLDGLRPERLNVSSDPESQVNDLNFWWADQQPADGDLTSQGELELVRSFLGDAPAEVAAAERFDLRDVAHIRNELLFRAIARHVASSEERDVDRCVAAFNLTTRHVALRVAGAADEPLTPFEVLLLGRGSPADRAWAFAEVLRQLSIDCVIISPRDSSEGTLSGDLLVGAILPQDGIYLFDPRIGLPIPAEDDDSEISLLPGRPATLDAARANDGILRQLDVPGGPAYPFTAERLQQITIRVVTHATLSAGRMASLQTALPEEFTALLFDGLGSSATRESGLLDRVRQAGAGGLWSPEDVQVWNFPETQTAAFQAGGGEAAPALRERMDILHGPRVLRKRAAAGGEAVNVIGESQQPLRYVRVQHLRGDLVDSLVSYGAIRSSNTGELREAVNEAAADEAGYWIAVCQYELGRYESALASTKLYRKTNPGGVWLDSIPFLQALCLAGQGQYQAAVQTLSDAAAGGAPSPRDSFLIRHWESLPDVTPAQHE
jgi:hypothetical protein